LTRAVSFNLGTCFFRLSKVGRSLLWENDPKEKRMATIENKKYFFIILPNAELGFKRYKRNGNQVL
jgi:hypothetical protein